MSCTTLVLLTFSFEIMAGWARLRRRAHLLFSCTIPLPVILAFYDLCWIRHQINQLRISNCRLACLYICSDSWTYDYYQLASQSPVSCDLVYINTHNMLFVLLGAFRQLFFCIPVCVGLKLDHMLLVSFSELWMHCNWSKSPVLSQHHFLTGNPGKLQKSFIYISVCWGIHENIYGMLLLELAAAFMFHCGF
jgi:hypothetical protein